jgi:Cu2+-exporting ATPase
MKLDYKIYGMTCNGCRSNVENALNGIQGITLAKVTLPDHAEIEMDNHISTETMQTALTKTGSYSIEMVNHANVVEDETSDNSDEHACCGGSENPAPILGQSAAGKYHCPMHCEGDKVYDDA